MAPFIIFLIFLTMAGASDAAWCICRSDVSNTGLQKTLDYACGAGADCAPIVQSGACYNPNTVLAHCSYAANSYYQRKGQAQEACDFTGTAVITSNDPSANGCAYPAIASVASSSSTPTSTSSVPSSTAPSNFSSTTPSNFSSTTGTGGLGGLSPISTTSFNESDGGLLPNKEIASLLLVILLSTLAFLET